MRNLLKRTQRAHTVDVGRIAGSNIGRNLNLGKVGPLIFQVVVGNGIGIDHSAYVLLLLSTRQDIGN